MRVTAMAMAMRMRVSASTASRRLGRHAHELAVTHPALGDDVLAEMLDVIAFPSEHRHFEAGVMIEMHMQRGERQLVMIVIGRCQSLGELACGVVVDIDQGRDAVAGAL